MSCGLQNMCGVCLKSPETGRLLCICSSDRSQQYWKPCDYKR